MDIGSIALTIVGLSLFEIISSVDNAIINAEVLSTMSKKARRWFLLWGMFLAVFVVRGILPFAIFWAVNPSMPAAEVFTAALSSDPAVLGAMEQSAPVLLAGGGTFLLFLFFHWLFLEPKHYGIKGEAFMHKQGVWFYAVVSVLLAAIVWFGINRDPMLAFGAVIGSTAFFITHGFKENAQEMEKKMIEGKTPMSDTSKILYLEMIDLTFSIDGVVGAFAFTLLVPLILIGNGIGAIIVRQLTVRNIENVKKYKYLKNGAMYSILLLGAVMIADSFGAHIPSWATPVITLLITAYFLGISIQDIRNSRGSATRR